MRLQREIQASEEGRFLEMVGILSQTSGNAAAASAQASPAARAGSHYGSPIGSPTSAAWGTPSGTPTTSNRLAPPTPTSGYRAAGPPPQVAVRKSSEAEASSLRVAVVAPGGGTGINGAVYADLDRNPRFRVDIVGQSRAPYDVYPPCWPHGAPAPNLETFAEEVLGSGVTGCSHCMVFGSRGGQVVLPHLWAAELQGRLAPVPPAFVINGGCAMNLPVKTQWPERAITFLLIGGQDNFRGNFSPEEYVSETLSHVPRANKTTAILYVNEMVHMPQQQLLQAVMGKALRGLCSWRRSGQPPLEHFRSILSAISKDGWSGRLLYTSAPGAWEDVKFAHFHVDRLPAVPLPAHSACDEQEVEAMQFTEFTKSDELRALWKAAARAARSGGNAPMASGCGNRFATVVKAVASGGGSQEEHRQREATLQLPIGRCGDTLQLPVHSRMGVADATPISRALGMPGRLPNSTPISPNSPFAFFPNDQSPSFLKVQ